MKKNHENLTIKKCFYNFPLLNALNRTAVEFGCKGSDPPIPGVRTSHHHSLSLFLLLGDENRGKDDNRGKDGSDGDGDIPSIACKVERVVNSKEQ